MPPSSMNGLPGADAMTDTLEFVRTMWGSMKIPGMAMPSLSPDEINKQITDLKAVESWLQLNMNMLRSSIQALEVQSATLTALQAMSQSFTQAVNPTGEASSDKPLFESPFAAFNAAPDKQADTPTPDGTAELPDTSAMAAQFANPAAWWNVVQDQFSQAVNQVVTPPAKKTVLKKSATKAPTKSAAKKPSAAATKKKTATSTVRKKKNVF